MGSENISNWDSNSLLFKGLSTAKPYDEGCFSDVSLELELLWEPCSRYNHPVHEHSVPDLQT